jgi:acyl-CoA thioesterase-1
MIALLAPLPAPAAIDGAAATILILGDSLSAGYGLDQNDGWVALLQQRLAQGRYPYQTVNASISGETTSGGLSRLPAELERHRPAIVVLELGGNDGLRGLPLAQMRQNLADMIARCQARQARVVLAGMQLPPNYGGAYIRGFEQVYAGLAAEHRVTLIPFLLAGLGEDRADFQADGIHPTREAQPVILDNVWKYLQPLLQRQ